MQLTVLYSPFIPHSEDEKEAFVHVGFDHRLLGDKEVMIFRMGLN